MKLKAGARLLAAIFAFALDDRLGAAGLPVYIEDNHAGTFYWLAQHLDLEEPCTLIHFDAHSDASGIFDSDHLRARLREVASAEEREGLLWQMRRAGVVQSFNWIEPLMPRPIAKVIWVPAEKLSAAEAESRAKEAISLLDGHLEAAPRKSGSFRDRYRVCDFEHLAGNLDDATPLLVTIDLDYFAGMPPVERADAFARVWNFVIERSNLRAVTFAISRPYLRSDAEADQLVELALEAARSVPTAEIEFEPFLSVAKDRSTRAQELQRAGLSLPRYDVSQAREQLRATLLAEKNRITVRHDWTRWENLLGSWEKEAAWLFLAVKNSQPSTDGVWRVPTGDPVEIELVAEPWLSAPTRVEWFALVPRYTRCNITRLSPAQVGFVADAAPRPVWNEIRLPSGGPTISMAEIDRYFEPRLHCGSLRLRARACVEGRIRETPILELRRHVGAGFRAALSEQFGLPYLFGSGQMVDGESTGPETNLGADCANFIIFALHRTGRRIPWTDPRGLRARLDRMASSVSPGEAHLTNDALEQGLIVDLGTHVAAVMEDRSPLGVLDQNDLVAHQLKGVPEIVSLGELLRDRKRNSFDLLRPASTPAAKLLFAGDVMLGRSCGRQVEQGLDPFRGIQSLLSRCSFAAANLECTISDLHDSAAESRYSFRAPRYSAKSLATAGFRLMSLANNHAMDFGPASLRDCVANLSREKVETIGAGATSDEAYRPKFFPLPNGTIALFATDDLGSKGNPGLELAVACDRARLKSAIAEARSGANFVVCLVHWGMENSHVVTDRQRELGRWLVEEGVDAVVGSHPHAIQPLDFYHGRPIAYSLGNLVFDGAPTVASWNHGGLLEIKLAPDGKVSSARLIDIVLRDGLPQIAADSPGGAGHTQAPCSN